MLPNRISELKATQSPKYYGEEVPKSFLETSIADLENFGLSLRVVNILEERKEWIYIHQLQGVTRKQLQEMRNMDDKHIDQLVSSLRKCMECHKDMQEQIYAYPPN